MSEHSLNDQGSCTSSEHSDLSISCSDPGPGASTAAMSTAELA